MELSISQTFLGSRLEVHRMNSCRAHGVVHSVVTRARVRFRICAASRNGSNGNGDHNESDNGNGAANSDNGSINWRDQAFPSYMQFKDRSNFCLDWELMLQEQERLKTDAERESGNFDRAIVSPMAPAWRAARNEAMEFAQQEPILSSFLYASILSHSTFEQSLSFVLANRLADATMLATQLMDVFSRAMHDDHSIGQSALLDLVAVHDRDPSCTAYSHALLFNKGYHALEAYRIMHSLWSRGQKVMAYNLQSRVSQMLAVDIHPAARNVTLGGTGRDVGDRHPKIRDGVLIGAGATILGNIEIGQGAQVAAGSLVLKPVKRRQMVAGSPAQVVGMVQDGPPALSMTQWPKSVDAEKAMRNWNSLLQSESNPAAKSSRPSASPSTSSTTSQSTSGASSTHSGEHVAHRETSAGTPQGVPQNRSGAGRHHVPHNVPPAVAGAGQRSGQPEASGARGQAAPHRGSGPGSAARHSHSHEHASRSGRHEPSLQGAKGKSQPAGVAAKTAKYPEPEYMI
eukprot:jgi/Botrbrau1/9188/Bobra.0236s0017.1